MTTSPEGQDFIRSWERFEPNWYKCSAGVWTIGYGHAVFLKYREPGPGDLPGGLEAPLTQAQAEWLFQKDLKPAEEAVSRLVQVDVDQGQFDAMVSLSFNVGVGAFKDSTLLQDVNAENFEAAADQFIRKEDGAWKGWIYANGEKVQGLINRRQAEKKMFTEEDGYQITVEKLHPLPILPPERLGDGLPEDPADYPIRPVIRPPNS